MSANWRTQVFQSGTQVVTRLDPSVPHYYIRQLAADNEGEHGRYEVSKELETWLNGGDEPWWMEFVNRTGADTALLPHGCTIRATGPMIDTATPPSWGIWREDDSENAQIDRGLLIDAICNRKPPLTQPTP